MSLSITDLKKGRKRLHEVAFNSLDGETVKLRELSRKRLLEIYPEAGNEDTDEALTNDPVQTKERLKDLVMAVLTDDDDVMITDADYDDISMENNNSFYIELIRKITEVHQGTGND